MSILSPSYIFLCLFTVSNYFSAKYYLGLEFQIPLLLSSAALITHIVESLMAGRKIIRINIPTVLILMTLLLFANSTYIVSIDAERSKFILENFTKVVVLYILVANIIRTPRQFQVYLLLLAVLTFFLSYRVLNFGSWSYGRVFIKGSQLVTTDPNYLALVLAYTLPLIGAAFISLKSKKRIVVQIVFAFIILRIIQGFLLTESRGGFLGLVIGVAVAFYLIKGFKQKAIALVILVPISTVFFARYVPMDYYYRMQEIIYPEADPTGSAEVRANSMSTAFNYMISHPISEYGLGNHSYLLLEEFQAYDLYEQGDGNIFRGKLMAHSFMLQIGADTGLVPLTLYLSFMGFLYLRLRKIVHFSPPDEDSKMLVLYAKSLIVAFAIICSGGFFLPMAYKPFIFYISGLADSLYNQYRNHLGELDERQEIPEIEAKSVSV